MDSLTQMNTETSPVLSSDSVILSPVKRGRGRPAKYAKEEREQKYKESTKKWLSEHKEYYKDTRKQYYDTNTDDIQKNKKEYYERSAYALRLLNDIWNHPDLIEFKSEDIKYKIQNLIEHKKIIIS